MDSIVRAALDRILYISIPEEIQQDINGFQINSSILMPVEIPAGETEWRMQDLSWEMIIAAMLKIFAWNPSHKDIEYYRDFINAVQPGINSEMTQMGILKAENKDFDIAEEIFRSLSNFNPDLEQNFINLALVYEEEAGLYEALDKMDLSEKKVEEAFDIYKKAVKRFPASEDIFFNSGNFYLKHGNVQKAVQLLTQFISVSKNQKKKDHTKSVLEKLRNLSSYDLLFKEAYELIKMGMEDSGIEMINQFLKNNPDVWNAWFLLGWAHRKTGNYEKGKEALLKSLTLNPDNVDTHNELAICLMEIGDYKECRKKLAAALRLDGDNIKIISNFGILALKQERKEEALAFFRTVLEIEPDDKIASGYIEFLTNN